MPRVLCIEDETEMSQLVEMILSRQGYDVATAATSQSALDQVAAQKPDVILLDLMLPDIDGWEVYEKLKSEDATRDIPVIVVTARAQHSEKTVALKVNQVDDYITKPFAPTQLVESVTQALKKHGR
jgi:two-component system, OmpR family, response regulator VicR